MSWVLVVFLYANAFSNSDSVALTTVAGFESAQLCQQAKPQVIAALEGGHKSAKAVCVRVK